MQGLRIISATGEAPSSEEVAVAWRVASTHKEMTFGVVRQVDDATGVTVEYHAHKKIAFVRASNHGWLFFSMPNPRPAKTVTLSQDLVASGAPYWDEYETTLYVDDEPIFTEPTRYDYFSDGDGSNGIRYSPMSPVILGHDMPWNGSASIDFYDMEYDSPVVFHHSTVFDASDCLFPVNSEPAVFYKWRFSGLQGFRPAVTATSTGTTSSVTFTAPSAPTVIVNGTKEIATLGDGSVTTTTDRYRYAGGTTFLTGVKTVAANGTPISDTTVEESCYACAEYLDKWAELESVFDLGSAVDFANAWIAGQLELSERTDNWFAASHADVLSSLRAGVIPAGWLDTMIDEGGFALTDGIRVTIFPIAPGSKGMFDAWDGNDITLKAFGSATFDYSSSTGLSFVKWTDILDATGNPLPDQSEPLTTADSGYNCIVRYDRMTNEFDLAELPAHLASLRSDDWFTVFRKAAGIKSV